jgi:hypothetical protein
LSPIILSEYMTPSPPKHEGVVVLTWFTRIICMDSNIGLDEHLEDSRRMRAYTESMPCMLCMLHICNAHAMYVVYAAHMQCECHVCCVCCTFTMRMPCMLCMLQIALRAWNFSECGTLLAYSLSRCPFPPSLLVSVANLGVHELYGLALLRLSGSVKQIPERERMLWTSSNRIRANA